tara:strand:+ start:35 stop:319 length:285 start_codon:yes stop_codon:yes gene_type:complete
MDTQKLDERFRFHTLRDILAESELEEDTSYDIVAKLMERQLFNISNNEEWVRNEIKILADHYRPSLEYCQKLIELNDFYLSRPIDQYPIPIASD